MKKCLIMLVLLGITTVAQAGIIDVVIDHYDDNDGSGNISPSDDVYIGIHTTVNIDIYDFDLHVSGPGTLSETAGGPNVNHATNLLQDFWIYSGIGPANSIAEISDGNLFGVWGPSTILVSGLVIHCDAPGPVLVDLTLYSGGLTGDTTTDTYYDDSDFNDLTIVQIPEPATLVLLGLGGLLLRRRK